LADIRTGDWPDQGRSEGWRIGAAFAEGARQIGTIAYRILRDFDRSACCALRDLDCFKPRAHHQGDKVKSKAVGALLFAVIGSAVFGGTILATAPSGLTNVTLARGTDVSDGNIVFKDGTDVVMSQITVIPGGSSGWHSHPGGAVIVVKEGTLTVYGSSGSQCQVASYTAGDAFIERPGEIDQVLNAGTAPYVLLVTFPRVPVGGSARTDVPDPGTCPGV
jgi:quercetin dioxygenase-like cupin family protein